MKTRLLLFLSVLFLNVATSATPAKQAPSGNFLSSFELPAKICYSGTFTQTDSGTGTLSWDALPGSGNYNINVYLQVGESYSLVQQLSSSTTSKVITSLASGSYKFVVTRSSEDVIIINEVVIN